MTNIELTENHKSKLLEMCKELFPINNIGFTDDYYCEWSLFLISDDDNDEMDVKDKIEIHWFEFCMTHLPEKIFKNPKGRFQGINGRPYWCEKVAESFAKVHPIDYLYEEFKKLK